MKDSFVAIILMCSVSIFVAGCKPQGVISENRVSEMDNSTLLQLKDSLRIMSTQITILESDLKRAREENINLRSETLIYEVNYDTNTTVDSLTKRPAVISEVYTVSKNLYEESVREYETLLREASVENRNLSVRNSNLELINESLEKENIGLMAESKTKFGFKNIVIVGVVVVLVLMGFIYKIIK